MHLSIKAAQLIKGLLTYNPQQRLSLHSVFRSNWVSRMAAHYKLNVEEYLVQDACRPQSLIYTISAIQSSRADSFINTRSHFSDLYAKRRHSQVVDASV